VDKRLLELLVCPVCKGPLRLLKGTNVELLCAADRLAYPVRDDIPVMLPDEARVLSATDPVFDKHGH
jgi:uncharacterized protein YbaR (Trm112 family)